MIDLIFLVKQEKIMIMMNLTFLVDLEEIKAKENLEYHEKP